MSSTHDIVIIGASFAGLEAATALLKDFLPKVAAQTKQTYKVIQIAPNESFLFKVALPRMLVKPEAIPLEKGLLPIRPAFKKYEEQYNFIQACASSIDHNSRNVILNTGATVKYDSLIIASGSMMQEYWTVADGDEKFLKAFGDIKSRIPKAQLILIAGGGPAGVETAGELGEVYGKTKDITILSGGKNLLASLKSPAPGKAAQSKLEHLGVKVVNGLRVISNTREGDKDIVMLSNGETRTVDLYIGAVGDKPNSGFVPPEWLDEKKKVKTDPQTLRLAVAGVKGVYAFGSVANYSTGIVFDIKFALPALMESIRLDLEGQEPSSRTKKIYKKFQSDMMLIPIGSSGGVSVIFGWQMPNFITWILKSRDFMIDRAPMSLPA